MRRMAPAALLVVLVAALAGWAGTRGDDNADAAPELVARGSFSRLAHPTEGRARLVQRGDKLTLSLRGFSTKPAPDLFVYLVPGSSYGERIESGIQLGRLKYVEGNQSYSVPSSVDPDSTSTVIVWCALCSSAWGRAELRSL